MSRVLSIDDIDLAAHALRQGAVMGIPTETVYGLAADISHENAVRRIFTLKNRPENHPLIIHIANMEQLSEYTLNVPPYVKILCQAFWPGPLTVVLQKSQKVGDYVTGGQSTVALRMPAHPIALDLIRRVGGAIAAPSANQFGRVSPTHYKHVLEAFDESIQVLDGGSCSIGIESTIVDATDPKKCVLLRPGMIDKQRIQDVLGRDIEVVADGAKKGMRVSGMLKSHYAPVKPTYLVSQTEELLALKALYDGEIYLLSFTEQWVKMLSLIQSMPKNSTDYAQNIYGALRRAEQSTAQAIVIESPPKTVSWDAIWDRILKASAHWHPANVD